jgi:hypothetical protein
MPAGVVPTALVRRRIKMSLPIAPAALISCGFLALTMRIPASVREFFKGMLHRVFDKIGDEAAEWTAKCFWYLVSLGIWYVIGHVHL